MRNMQPRIWNKITGEIAMIDVIDWNDKYVIVSHDYIWNEDPETGEGDCQVYFKDLELMWPTGLKDKNGVEIFEGDIIEFEFKGEKHRSIIKEHDCDKSGYCWWMSLPLRGEFQVIGNIHESPELLKEVEV